MGRENRFLYNQGTGDVTFNTERVSDLGVDWDMTKYRAYDYTLGRFLQVDPKADVAGQVGWTPYHYGFNNPIRYSDPMGDCPPGVDCQSFFLGFGASVVDNITFGLFDVRGAAAGYADSGRDFNSGQDAGDAAMIGAGTGMVSGGAAAAEGGSLVLAGSGGTTAPVSGTVAVAGAATALVGGALTVQATANLASQKGRVNMEGGRRSGRSKNNRQPDPEATGDHSVIDRNGATTYRKEPRNHRGFQQEGHIDTKGRPHTNKLSGEDIPVPHRQGRDIDGNKILGGVEPVPSNKAPRYRGVDEMWFVPRIN